MLNPLNFLSKIIKSSNQKELDKLKNAVKKINEEIYYVSEREDIKTKIIKDLEKRLI